MTEDDARAVAQMFMVAYRNGTTEEDRICRRMFAMATVRFPEFNWKELYREFLLEVALVNWVTKWDTGDPQEEEEGQ